MIKKFFIFLVLFAFLGGAVFLFVRNTRSSNSNLLSTASPTASQPAPTASPISSPITTTMENGLKIQDTVVGTGAEAKNGNLLTVHYTGTLLNGKKFDSSIDRGQPFQFVLGAGMVIKGWDLGFAGMKVGGKRKLTIPAALAYGDRAVGDGMIPAGSTLIFDVELLAVEAK